MRCVREGVEIPKPWEARPDYSNEMVKLKERIAKLEAVALHAGRMLGDPSWERHQKNLKAALKEVDGE